MISQYLFYFLSFVSILSALMVVFSKNPVYSVLYLIVTFFAIAGHYFLLNAQFLGMVHIIVYAGAIMVLFLYVIMMLNLNKEDEANTTFTSKVAAAIAGGLFLLVMVAATRSVTGSVEGGVESSQIGSIENLGKVLFSENGFLLPFEISSILFLASMVGAVFLSKKEIH
ncbi:MAG: NADH-quinone oxidoreductase subunit J [Saprospiraceae bacterium]